MPEPGPGSTAFDCVKRVYCVNGRIFVVEEEIPVALFEENEDDSNGRSVKKKNPRLIRFLSGNVLLLLRERGIYLKL